jgi:diketogulonate reductase-like aldo/keto reductase
VRDLRRKELASFIIGASRPEQIEDNIAATGVALSNDVLTAIDKAFEGIIVYDAPTSNTPGMTSGVKHRA